MVLKGEMKFISLYFYDTDEGFSYNYSMLEHTIEEENFLGLSSYY